MSSGGNADKMNVFVFIVLAHFLSFSCCVALCFGSNPRKSSDFPISFNSYHGFTCQFADRFYCDGIDLRITHAFCIISRVWKCSKHFQDTDYAVRLGSTQKRNLQFNYPIYRLIVVIEMVSNAEQLPTYRVLWFVQRWNDVYNWLWSGSRQWRVQFFHDRVAVRIDIPDRFDISTVDNCGTRDLVRKSSEIRNILEDENTRMQMNMQCCCCVFTQSCIGQSEKLVRWGSSRDFVQ